ncbi:protein of unknown function [Candidatus Methylopumilus planktonicus]|uniref:Primase C-terminal 1 domain-containing protein n=1 Tax=Candidatus Methylopumilus planktonicus TaxID=1581557 RepID=A0A0D6ETG2_9PROT|nr:AAA family ATPase [Candidatus Methylopumilus planktonicus]CEZ19034.1 protein of unknown function [Candidatus Methylopumilus planktonicus]
MYLTKYKGLGTKGTPININWSQFANSNLQIVSEKTRATSTGFYQLREPYERKDINVITMHCVKYDLDHTTLTFDQLVESLSPYEALITTTYSHNPENGQNKYRVIINTDRDVNPDEYQSLFNGFIKKNLFLLGQVDTAVKDKSRLFLDWSCPPDRQQFARKEVINGQPIIVDEILEFDKKNQLHSDQRNQLGNVSFKDLLKGGITQGGSKGLGRNDALTKFLGHLLHNKFNPTEAREMCIAWNQSNIPPMPDDEVERTINSILNKHQSESPQIKEEKRYQLLSVSDIQKLPKIDWLVKDVLPAQGLACIYGPSGSSKSFLALDLSLSIACKTEWFGLKIKCVPVIYIVLEGLQGFIKRVNAWVLQNKIRPKRFFLIRDDINLFNFADVSDLVASLQEANFVNGLIVIDTLNQASPGVDENSVKEISQVLNHLKFIQRETNSLTLIVHHSGKDVNRGLRGSSSIRAALDTSIEVSSESYTQKEWRIEKSKDSADGQTYKYSLKEITLGQDEDQSPITSCVVTPGEKVLFSKPKPTGKNQKIAHSKVELLLILSPISGKCFQMPDTKMIEVEDAVEEISKAFTTTEQSKRRNQARTALQSLISNGFIHTGSEDGKDYLWTS